MKTCISELTKHRPQKNLLWCRKIISRCYKLIYMTFTHKWAVFTPFFAGTPILDFCKKTWVHRASPLEHHGSVRLKSWLHLIFYWCHEYLSVVLEKNSIPFWINKASTRVSLSQITVAAPCINCDTVGQNWWHYFGINVSQGILFTLLCLLKTVCLNYWKSLLSIEVFQFCLLAVSMMDTIFRISSQQTTDVVIAKTKNRVSRK